MAKKYHKGDSIYSLDEIAKQDFVYIGDKIYHAGWFKSLQFSYINRQMNSGYVFKAERRAEDGK